MSIQRLFTLCFLAISALFALALMASSAATLLFLQSSSVVSGTVTGYREIVNYAPFGLFAAGEAKRFFVEAEYEAADASGGRQRYTITADRGAPEQQYAIGDTIPIRHHNRVLERARIDTPAGRWGNAIVFALLTAVFGLLGWIARFAFRLGNDRER